MSPKLFLLCYDRYPDIRLYRHSQIPCTHRTLDDITLCSRSCDRDGCLPLKTAHYNFELWFRPYASARIQSLVYNILTSFKGSQIGYLLLCNGISTSMATETVGMPNCIHTTQISPETNVLITACTSPNV